jgi:hypothetical protein
MGDGVTEMTELGMGVTEMGTGVTEMGTCCDG